MNHHTMNHHHHNPDTFAVMVVPSSSAVTTEEATPTTTTIRSHDVLCGRGKVDHAGNAYFRQVVAEQLDDFKRHQASKNRYAMAQVVQHIVQKVHDTGGRFMDQNWRGVWVELSEKERRQKVDRACRDAKKNSLAAAAAAAASSRKTKATPHPTTTGIHYDTIHGTNTTSSSSSSSITTPTLTPAGITTNQTRPATLPAPYPPSHPVTTEGTTPPSIHHHHNNNHHHDMQPPPSMAHLYTLSSSRSNNNSIGNSGRCKANHKRTSRGELVPGTDSTSHIQEEAPMGAPVTTLPSFIGTAQPQNVPPQLSGPTHTTLVSDHYQIGNPTYHDDIQEDPTTAMMMESSISSFEKVTNTTARTLSSTYITAPTLEFSCGSLALENSFVIQDNNSNSNNQTNHHSNISNHPNISNLDGHQNEPSIPTSIRSKPPGQPRNSTDVILKKNNSVNNNNNNNNSISNASANWTNASLSSIPNDFLNRSGISDMDFSAVSLDLFSPPIEEDEEEGGTERSTDTETEHENPAAAHVRNDKQTLPLSTETNDPLAMLRGPNERSMHQALNETTNNESTTLSDTSVSVMDLHQSYAPDSLFDASYNQNSCLLDSSVTSVTGFTNSNTEQPEQYRRSTASNSGNVPQQRDRSLDRYDLLKREESVDTIIAGNLRRHSQVSKAGGGQQSTAVDCTDELTESFNMSIDICALPSTNEEGEEEETPRTDRVVKHVLQGPQRTLQSPLSNGSYQKSPEKKKLKDLTMSPTQRTNGNLYTTLWSSTDEL